MKSDQNVRIWHRKFETGKEGRVYHELELDLVWSNYSTVVIKFIPKFNRIIFWKISVFEIQVIRKSACICSYCLSRIGLFGLTQLSKN